ncbi:glycosyltransferase [Marinifilum sp. D737]|uniref:glycosyltransferase n=1 Tax=Marinifilum sp. D737 TaxID=2969628 RepID=UPI002276E2C4|nr:glycosyltransferase [Marinifilum sp. D737]MCY1635008.1 glycosyltransferase [Marinifilum sp. D737]
MNKFHWIEAKQLDRVTNYSTEIEPIKYALNNNIEAFYYCTFEKKKKYFGFNKNIKYLGFFRKRFIKAIEFQMLVVFKAISIVLFRKNSVIMVNQDLIRHMLPAVFFNKILKQQNKFITDIRTTPTGVHTFEKDMKSFHSQFQIAIKHFHGFSFITPFMEEYIMSEYRLKNYRSVNWSSGVDIDLFNPIHYNREKTNEKFTLFYHGGISISRGNLNLIKAAEKLVKKGYNIELVQVGIAVDKEIEKYIENNNLSSWCQLLPPVPLEMIPQYIANADLPVLPFPHFMAWRVSSPIKLMEYLAMGKKVLAPNMESFTDVFGQNSDLVFYFNSTTNDPIAEMTIAIQKILDNKLLNNDNFYSESRDFVTKNYTWEKQAANLFNFCGTL